MSRRREWITAIIVVVVVWALTIPVGTFIYINVFKEEGAAELVEGCAATGDTTPPTSVGGPALDLGGTGSSLDPSEVAGTWTVEQPSVVGYRVTENLFGQDATAVGRTTGVTGSVTVEGEQVTAVQIEVDMTGFTSPESRRDSQFNGRIMSVQEFPTATFVLTAPAPLPSGATQNATAVSGDLTLRGVTNPVTVDMTALDCGDFIDVVGRTTIVFDDFSIPQPSAPGVSVGDDGILELKLRLVRG